MELTDEGLVQRFKEGDPSSFETLVRRYEKKVFSLIYHLIGDPSIVEDLAQEVFIKIYNSLNNFRGESSFKTWLYRIIVNTCANEGKRRGKYPLISLDQSLLTEEREREFPLSSRTLNPAELAERKELGRVLMGAIGSLPLKYRETFVLKELEGLSYQEIAKTLGCSLGTVESRLHRARAQLKEKLKTYL